MRICLIILIVAGGLQAQFTKDFKGVACERLWTNTISELDRTGFDPENLDRQSLFGRFTWRNGALAWGQGAGEATRTFTNQYSNIVNRIAQFGIQYASLSMADSEDGCMTTLRINYQALRQNFAGQTWIQLTSNGVMEGRILNRVEPVKPEGSDSGKSARVIITSEPTGAEIWIDGKFVGSTPSTKEFYVQKTIEVAVVIRGGELWKRAVEINFGDEITLHADLTAGR